MKRSRSIISGIDAVWWRRVAVLVLACGLAGLVPAMADQDTDKAGSTTALMLTVDGAIGPATTEYLTDGIEEAEARGADLLILKLDTPGGLTAATRDIVKAIRGSSVPVATWVAPTGARAASAGTYILYASHVAAMAPATNVGAATPVSIGGGGSTPSGDREQDSADDSSDQDKKDSPDEAKPAVTAEKRKALNDAAAWIRGLAEETGRNGEWAERAVREAVSLTADEAVEKNVADFIAADRATLLQQASGRKVTVAGQPVTLQVAGASVESIEPDWRAELLAVITNPTVAYLLMMIGIYGLLLEGYNPGALVPGTVGAICLLLALYAFQVLPVNYVGLLLILLGIILIVSEALVPSFGALGFGGIAAFVFGSIVLMDTDVPGFEIAIEAIGSIALVSTLLLFGLVWMAVRAWQRPVVTGADEIDRATGEVIEPVDADGGWVLMLGERWSARSDRPIPAGQRVRVIGRDGLTVRVEPVSDQEE